MRLHHLSCGLAAPRTGSDLYQTRPPETVDQGARRAVPHASHRRKGAILVVACPATPLLPWPTRGGDGGAGGERLDDRGGVGDPAREAASAAAKAAGVPLGAWVERAVRQALRGEPGPAPAAGGGLGELEATVRRVVAEELRPLREALARLGTASSLPGGGGSSLGLLRARMRHRRQGR